MTRLRYLNISENAFTELPAVVCDLESLLELRAMVISPREGVSSIAERDERFVD